MINIIPLPMYSNNWEINQSKMPREYVTLVPYAIKYTINKVPVLKKYRWSVNVTNLTLKRIHELNQKYRNKDCPTNVLSFPADALPLDIDFEGQRELGDIFICMEVIQIEAQALNLPLLEHLAHMLVHSTLHLLGYDHENPVDEKKMQAKEVLVLTDLNIPNPYL